jgi:predicted Zn-dependent peptidase
MIYHKKILPNGLRVVTVPMKDNPTVTVLVMVEAGSKYETKEVNGISHFLEHMCFKGTKNRPKSIDISRELDSVGSEYNAFTSQEFTGYYAKADYRHIDKVLDVVSDLYLNPTFPEAEMEKEKGVITEEINMYQDLPQRRVQDLFMELLYGDQPAGWNIAGPKENIKKMKIGDFWNYRKAHYLPGKTVVAVAGNFPEKAVLKKVEQKFGEMSRGAKNDKLPVKESQEKPEIKIEFKKTDQTHLVLGVRSFDMYYKKEPVMQIIATILGGGMSSRMFQKMREELGICYYAKAGDNAFTDHGFLEAFAGVDNTRLNEAISAILEEFRRLKDEPVSKEELQKAKDYFIGSMFLGLESSDSLAEYYGGQEIFKKKIKNPDQVAKEIKKVTAKDVAKIAKEIFQDKDLNLAIVGPVENTSSIEKILKIG